MKIYYDCNLIFSGSSVKCGGLWYKNKNFVESAKIPEIAVWTPEESN